jgi:hypothetical protein
LVTGTAGAWASGTADAAGLRQALRQATEDDAADAEAICEAVSRANMRFIETKTAEQQNNDRPTMILSLVLAWMIRSDMAASDDWDASTHKPWTE